MSRRFDVTFSPRAKRQLAEVLPAAVAFAALEFIDGPLRDNPHRAGKPLHEPLVGRYSARRGTFRIIYTIDDERVVVLVLTVAHRAGVYRPD
jgi:Cytotoxic translational repressor of toxin-antitoxin stability system